ncbi:MAG: NUDIX hydrolase [Nocardioidaceae bacterium]
MTLIPAAGVAAFSRDGRLLLGRHAHDSRWATLGGGVEEGESADEAARREVLEEVGLRLNKLAFLGSFGDKPIYDVQYPDDSVVSYRVDIFGAIADDTNPRPDGNEIVEAGWFALEDLVSIDLAPDMTEIVPAAFEWFDQQQL